MNYDCTALVTLLSLVVYFGMAGLVGRARGKYQIAAPATTGHADFERVFRVHQNTMESLVMYLPALWLFAIYVSSLYASLLGLVWIAGRVVYARGYYVEASKRGTGTMISLAATAILLLGALGGVVMAILRH